MTCECPVLNGHLTPPRADMIAPVDIAPPAISAQEKATAILERATDAVTPYVTSSASLLDRVPPSAWIALGLGLLAVILFRAMRERDDQHAPYPVRPRAGKRPQFKKKG